MITDDSNEMFLVIGVDLLKNEILLKSLKNEQTYEVCQDRDVITNIYENIDKGIILSNTQIRLNIKKQTDKVKGNN